MSYQYFIADVFTDTLFSGAQIAVFPSAEALTEEQMQLLARELNFTETVFVSPGSDNSHWHMRTFSPLQEKEFVGHPIIATAYVLANAGKIDASRPVSTLTFTQKSGNITVHVYWEDGKVSKTQFDQKVTSLIDRFAPPDEELANFLSLTVSELDHKKYAPRLISTGFPYLIVPLWNYESVRNARFNYDAWSRSIAPQTAAQEILIFAPSTPDPDSQFNLRLVGPKIGHLEDPPVGSAIPAFTSYLCSFDFTPKGTHAFAVDRGENASRRSLINIEMDNKVDTSLKIRVGGQAVIFSEGHVFM